MQFYWSTSCATRAGHLAERYFIDYREDGLYKEESLFSLDGKPVVSDGVRMAVSTELPNATVTVLHIVASRPSDSGSYRCSDGHSVQSKEAKLSLRDTSLHAFIRSLSSSTSSSVLASFRTVVSLLTALVLLFFDIL